MTSDTPHADHTDTDKTEPTTPKAIAFEHRFFHAVEKPMFRTLEDTGEPVMTMSLDHGEVSLKLSGIVKELKLRPDEPDAKMLDIVRQSLKFVREICVGDPVPSEITSGRASWEITDKHRAISHNRITMQTVSWMSGEETVITDPGKLDQVAGDPKTKAKINDAFSKAAKALGLDESDKDQVVQLIANLANELAYIEALREVFKTVQSVYAKVKELENKYASDQSVSATILSVKRLFKIALEGFQSDFDQLDAQTSEILSALTNIGQVTKFIRANRDTLHQRLWAWDRIIEDWRLLTAKRSSASEKLLAELYHFLAQRFLPRHEWELYSQALDKTKHRSTEVVW